MNILSELAEKHNTDKGVAEYGYTEIYHDYFKDLREEAFCLLEIGVGGYSNPLIGGESLRMWAEYFPSANIHGVDIYNKRLKGRFTTHKGSQIDEKFMYSLLDKIGAPLIIVDDGSHINTQTIKTFNILFPCLIGGGFYVIEDLQTSYIEKEYGGTMNISNLDNKTAVNHLFLLYHYMNIIESNIQFIHLYKNVAIIKKKI